MRKKLSFIGIALALLILLAASLNVGILGRPVLATAEKPDTCCQVPLAAPQDEGSQQIGPDGTDLEQALPIMKPSRETRQKWIEQYNKAPKAHINEQIKRKLEQAPGDSISLLSHLQYTPSERNQGSCGDCWAWGGTGVMEIALDVQNAIKDRLSIQYLNSNYNGGSGPEWACCGGWLYDVANFYTSTGRAIPWSNTNASYGDGSRTCGSGSTGVPAGTISTTPYYPITSINTQSITTQGVSQTTAIANIKNILNQNKAVWVGFFLPTAADWSNFSTFWSTQSESAIWDPDFSCGHTWDAGGGGHAVLCVGYDDEAGTANDYWIVLNSWGTAGGSRPSGLLRLAMDMNYSCQDGDGDYTFYWQTLNATFQDPVQTQRLIGVATDTASTGGGGSCTNIHLERFQANATGSITEFKVKTSASGNVKVAIYSDSSGQPNSRLAAVDTSTPVTSGWNTIPINPSVAVTSGNYYWLAVVSDSCNIYYHSNDPSANTIWKPSTYSSWYWPGSAGPGWNTQTGYTYFIAGWGTTTPPSAPTVTNSTGASNIASTSARLNGEVTSTGGENPSVTVYYGTTDGGTTPGSWANHVDLGAKGQEIFSTDVSNLTPNTSYYYRCYAINSAGPDWADTSAQFTTLVQTQRLIGVAPDTASTGGGGSCTNIHLERFQANATGSITEFKVKTSASGNVKVAIYSDSSGQPDSRLAAVDTSTPVNSGWNTIPITPSIAVNSGTYYWLAVVSDSCNIYYHSNDPSANTIWKPSTYSSWYWPGSAGPGWNTQTGYTYFIAGWGTTTPPTPPNPPDLLSPGAAITFKWGAPNGATKYQLQVSTSSSFNTTVFDADVGNNTSQEVTGLSLGTLYYWRVRAGNDGGWSDWSTTRSVTVNQVP